MKNMEFNKAFDEISAKNKVVVMKYEEEDDKPKEIVSNMNRRIETMVGIKESTDMAEEAMENDKNLKTNVIIHLCTGMNALQDAMEHLNEDAYHTYVVNFDSDKTWNPQAADEIMLVLKQDLAVELDRMGLIYIGALEDGFVVADKW